MPVELTGSCHCGAVKFTVCSSTLVPYFLCLCSICRKVGGVGGSIYIRAYAKALEVNGKENLSVYNAVMNRGTKDEKVATSERNFCQKCSSMLWLYNDAVPELVHLFASAIDSPALKDPETIVCHFANSKPDYVRLPEGRKEVHQERSAESIEDWHKRHGEYVP